MTAYCLNEVDAEYRDLDDQADHIHALESSIQAISTYGLNQTSFQVMKTTGLLSGSSLGSIATEAVSRFSAEDVESSLAMESLIDKIKDKVASWSAKLITFFKDSGNKILEVIKGLANRLKAAGKRAMEKVADKANSAKKYVKAHPYKTIAAVLLAAAAAVSTVAFATKFLPAFSQATKFPAFIKALSKMIGVIKWPLGKVATAIANSGTKVKLILGTTVVIGAGGTAAELYWNRESISKTIQEYGKLENGMDTVYEGIRTKCVNAVKDAYVFVKSAGKSVWHAAVYGTYTDPNASAVRVAATTVGAMTLTAFAVAVAGVGYLVYQLLRNFVLVAFRMACMTMVAMGGAGSGEEEQTGGFL